MKLTDELCDAIADCARTWNWESMSEASARVRIREDLQGTFDAVPDPEEVRAEIMEGLAYGRSVERQMLDARISELETKLTELRTFLYGWLLGAKAALQIGQLPPERFDEFIDTLKLEPPPEGEP